MPDPVGSRLDYTPALVPACEPQGDGEQPAQSTGNADALICPGPLADPSTPQTIAGPHAEAHASRENIDASAFVLKGRDATSGVEVEVFSISAHDNSEQSGAQAGMARIGISSDNGHFNVRGEAFTAKVHAGTQNSDGSVGVNVGLGVTAVGAEATGTFGPASLTVGASVSLNLAGSVGIREADAERNTSLCARVELEVFTLGTCIEKVW